MMSRRGFLTATGSALYGAPASPRAGCQTNAWRIDSQNFHEVLAVIDKIKGYDYRGFETGFRNVQGQFADPSTARRELDKRGLEFLGCHIFLLEYDRATLLAPADLVETVARGSSKLGAKRLILSGGSAGRDATALSAKIRALNTYGKLCRSLGLQLAYHNHDKEFLNGRAEIEGMLKGTDPELLHLMMDAGHAYLGHADVPEFFSEHASRIDGLHLRDFRGQEQVPLGSGEFDLRPLARGIRAKGWSGWLINEEERLNDVRPGDAAVAPARKHLRAIFGV